MTRWPELVAVVILAAMLGCTVAAYWGVAADPTEARL